MATISRNSCFSDAASPERVARMERLLGACIQRITALEKRLDASVPDPDRWERMAAYADRKGVSIRTVDRDVERGVLEKRKDPGSNRAYVREVLSQPVRKPRGRRSPLTEMAV
jgi:hypothetical protein